MSEFEWQTSDSPPDPSDLTVLVVEDEHDLADLYSTWLSGEFDVKTAYDGAEAIDMVDSSVDVVLLDRRLPDIRGGEVLEEIRGRGLDCQVALVSAVDPDFDILPMEFDEYIKKPVTQDELVALVSDLGKRRGLHDELRHYFSILAKKSKLESEKSPGELEGNVTYEVLRNELQELRSEFDYELTELASGRSDQQREVPRIRVAIDGALIGAVGILLVGIYVFTSSAAPPEPVEFTARQIPTELIFSAFLHRGVSHLAGNVFGYLLFAFMTYYLCIQLDAVRWFRFTAPVLIFAISFLAPLASYELYQVLFPEWEVFFLGFSAVVAGFGGYSLLATLFVFRQYFDSRTVFLLGGFIIISVITGVLWAVGRGLSLLGAAGIVATLFGAYFSYTRSNRIDEISTTSPFSIFALAIPTSTLYVGFGLLLFPTLSLENVARIDVFGHFIGLLLGFGISFATAFVVNIFPINDSSESK